MTTAHNPLIEIDVYKDAHEKMNPTAVTSVYSTWTCRRSRIPGVDYSVFFGLANALDVLHQNWHQFFDSRSYASQCIDNYASILGSILNTDDIPVNRFWDLYEYGRLPITIHAVPEGTKVPIRTPSMVIESSAPHLAWVTQFLETSISNMLWKPITSATLSVARRQKDFAALEMSGGPMGMLDYLNHDFSYRGMSFIGDAVASGMGHLVGSNGTDTVPAVARIKQLYSYSDLPGKSIAASEHSVSCLWGPGRELEMIRHILRQFPNRPVSIVGDTWSLWKFISEYLVQLGDALTMRTAPLVVRPDSGDPVKILTGDPDSSEGIARQGVVPFLLAKFQRNARVTTKGYQLLPLYLGTVYGDSMNPERCDLLNKTLLSKQICPSVTVRGIGSFTYEYQTRDTLGQALKAVEGVIEGTTAALFKDPITDTGEKKSAKGRVALLKDKHGVISGYVDEQDGNAIGDGGFTWLPVLDGVFEMSKESFDIIRQRATEVKHGE